MQISMLIMINSIYICILMVISKMFVISLDRLDYELLSIELAIKEYSIYIVHTYMYT